ncbi:MAG TPA: GNAT family N-acetyltransferase, partial [Chthoniobacterales bacterium]|nr:GNAT family N-acetyltransferase [Chthoniobacterales bacterium]
QGGALSKPPVGVGDGKSGRFGKRPSLTIPFPSGLARVLSLAELQDCPAWPSAFATKSKDHRFYEIVEQTLDSNFEHHYLVLEDGAGKVRAVQPLFFVQQNLVEGIPAMRGAVDFIRRRFPRFLTMRVLMAGNAAGEGHLGARAPEDEEWVADALFATLKIYARQAKASLVVFKDFPARYRQAMRNFSAHGYTRVPSMPMTELPLHYTDFEHYVSTLGSSTRKDLRRKFRKVAAAPAISVEVLTDLTPFVDDVYPLYLQVHERSPLKFERLTKKYLIELGRRMPDRVRFFLWRQGGKAIAFSVALVHAGTIYDDYLGLDYRVALDLHLYFYTLRDIIRWALGQGLERYRSSPLNYHPKLHLGCDLYPLDLYVQHTSAWLNPIFRPALKFLEPTRHDKVLKRFRNADQLHS